MACVEYAKKIFREDSILASYIITVPFATSSKSGANLVIVSHSLLVSSATSKFQNKPTKILDQSNITSIPL